VKFINVPEGYLITDLSSDEIAISLKGNGWLLAQLTFGRESVFEVDVKNKIGSQSILMRNQVALNSWISSNLQITELSPSILSFNVEKLFEKVVPIKQKFKVIPKDGFGIVSSLKIEPALVRLKGSKKNLEKISFVETYENTYSDLSEPLNTEIEIKPIKDIILVPAKIKVEVEIEKIVDKSIDGVTVQTTNVPKNQKLEIIPTQIQVILRGGLNKLASINGSDVKAFVDFNDALRDTLGTIVPNIVPPEHSEVLTIKPQRLKYIIKKY